MPINKSMLSMMFKQHVPTLLHTLQTTIDPNIIKKFTDFNFKKAQLPPPPTPLDPGLFNTNIDPTSYGLKDFYNDITRNNKK